jgi:hypothetical protein
MATSATWKPTFAPIGESSSSILSNEKGRLKLHNGWWERRIEINHNDVICLKIGFNWFDMSFRESYQACFLQHSRSGKCLLEYVANRSMFLRIMVADQLCFACHFTIGLCKKCLISTFTSRLSSVSGMPFIALVFFLYRWSYVPNDKLIIVCIRFLLDGRHALKLYWTGS